ncbi:MAG: gamma-glutamyl-gamma-aminobutyrate hydrolase family protein [Halothece sp.]
MMMSKPPIIGITTEGRDDCARFRLYANYADSIRHAEGVPILLPPGETHIDRLLDLIDGLVITGGGDVDPQRYLSIGHATISEVDRERDEFEFTLAEKVLASKKPVLGICRGMQILSLASGLPELVPHLPETYGDTVLHAGNRHRFIPHQVSLNLNSRLYDIIGKTQFTVMSLHHQGIEATPPHWQAVGYSEDGLIEAIEHQSHPWAIALQWHPEMSPADENHQKIFQAFVQAAAVPVMRENTVGC